MKDIAPMPPVMTIAATEVTVGARSAVRSVAGLDDAPAGAGTAGECGTARVRRLVHSLAVHQIARARNPVPKSQVSGAGRGPPEPTSPIAAALPGMPCPVCPTISAVEGAPGREKR